MTEESLYEMYRLMAIAKYDERYVIPNAHVEQAHELEEIGCSLDYDEGPGMYESGPFGEASGRPVPVAVETFNALKQRQTSDARSTPGPRSCAAGSTCSTGTATAHRTGSSRTKHGRRQRRHEAPAPAPAGSAGSSTRSPPGASTTRRARCSSGCRCSAPPWPSSRRAGGRAARRAWSGTSAAPRSTACSTPTSRSFDLSRKHALYLSYWTDGDTRRRGEVLARFKAAYRASGFLVDTRGELPDYLPMVLEFAAVADPAAGPAAAAGVPAEPGAAAHRAGRGAARRTPACVVAVCATLPGAVARRPRGRAGDGRRRAPRPSRSASSRTTRGCSRCSRSGERAMDVLLWGVLPYVVIAILVGGTIWRYRYDKFGWTTRSSQLYESRLLRIGSPLFHFGILVVLVGHVGGLVIPESWTEAVGITRGPLPRQRPALRRRSPASARWPASSSSSTAGARTGPVFMATTGNDKVMYVLLVGAIVARPVDHAGQRRRRLTRPTTTARPCRRGSAPCSCCSPTSTPWRRRRSSSTSTCWSAMLLFALWPFTRLVHAFTAPLHYLFRPYIVYRSRDAPTPAPGRVPHAAGARSAPATATGR